MSESKGARQGQSLGSTTVPFESNMNLDSYLTPKGAAHPFDSKTDLGFLALRSKTCGSTHPPKHLRFALGPEASGEDKHLPEKATSASLEQDIDNMICIYLAGPTCGVETLPNQFGRTFTASQKQPLHKQTPSNH